MNSHNAPSPTPAPGRAPLATALTVLALALLAITLTTAATGQTASAQEGTEAEWPTTLTVGTRGQYTGYTEGSNGFGSLSGSAGFYVGSDYNKVRALYLDGAGNLYLALRHDLRAASPYFVLTVDGEKFHLSDIYSGYSTFQGANAYQNYHRWASPGLSWSTGDTIEITLDDTFFRTELEAGQANADDVETTGFTSSLGSISPDTFEWDGATYTVTGVYTTEDQSDDGDGDAYLYVTITGGGSDTDEDFADDAMTVQTFPFDSVEAGNRYLEVFYATITHTDTEDAEGNYNGYVEFKQSITSVNWDDGDDDPVYFTDSYKSTVQRGHAEGGL